MNVNSLQAFRVERQIADLPEHPGNYRLISVTAGKLNIFCDGQNDCAVAGQVVITVPTNCERTFCPSDDFAGDMLQICDQPAAELIQRYLLYMKAGERSIVVLNTENQLQSIRSLMESISGELLDDTIPAAAIVELRLQELLVRLHNANSGGQSDTCSNREDIVSGVHELLKKKFYTALSLESIASEHNISVSYLAHIFKEITGTSVMRCLLLIRIREAQKYLEQTNMPINEIVGKSGFNNVSNFGRTFKKETGFSPRQYRLLHSRKAGDTGR